MNVKLSIITSLFNEELFIEQTIKSILSQTFTDFEWILINDASIDRTLTILTKFASQNPRIKIINNDTNIGLTKSLNKGISLASGKYIVRIDGADISLPERLKIQFNFMESHPEVFLSGSAAEHIDENNMKTTIFRPVTEASRLKDSLEKKCSIYHSTIIFKHTKDTFYRDKFIYSQDYDLYLRCLSENKILTNLPDILVKYRVSPTSISFSKRAQQMLFAEKALEFYHQRKLNGQDTYNLFDQNAILKIDVKKINDPKIIKQEIKAAFRINDFKTVKLLYYSYFRYKKIPDRMFIFYTASFLPKKMINALRKLFWG